jgi:tetratricopeptide (TPR) repeat protein
VAWIIRAAEGAYNAGSMTAAMSLAERGLAHANGEPRGVLRAIQGVCAGAQYDLEKAMPALRDAMTLLPKGGHYWFVSASNIAFYGAFAGNPFASLELGQAIADIPAIATRGGLYAWSVARVVLAFIYVGQPDMAKTFLCRLETAAALETAPEPSLVGWLQMARLYAAYHGKREDLAEAVRNARGAIAIFEDIKDSMALASARFWQSGPEGMLGRYGELRRILADGLARAEQCGNSFLVPQFGVVLGWADVLSGRPADAVERLTPLTNHASPSVKAGSAVALARALLLMGDTNAAETAADAAVQATQGMIPFESIAHATLASVLLARGRANESLAAADRALAFPVIHGIFFDNVSLVRSEALAAIGRTEDARGVLREARDRLLRIAATLEVDDRASYLTNVDANVRILARASEWLEEG